MVDKLKSAFGDISDVQRVLGLIYSDLLEFFQRSYKFFRRRAWHLCFAVNWGLFERRFKSIIERLVKHCDLLNREAAAIHYTEMRRMRDTHQHEVEQFELRRQEDMVGQVISRLSAVQDSQENRLHEFADERQPGTCNWILTQDHVYPWIENETGEALLWLTGIPGAGKSFLCSLIVEHLQQRERTEEGQVTVLYYFCGRGAEDTTCALLLKTLLVQLLLQNMDLVPVVHQKYLQKLAIGSIVSIRSVLQEVLSNVKRVRIIIDGVDECAPKLQLDILKSLVELLKGASTLSHSGANFCKILCASRNEPQINKAIPRRVHFELEDNTNKALALYIHTTVEGLKEHHYGMQQGLFDRVEERLMKMANGMFLWVRLVREMLREQTTEIDFESAIEELPEGLNEAYRRILDRITSLGAAQQERALRVLFWICAAYRPVSIHEVTDGIALKPGQTTLGKKTRSLNPERDFLELCAPLVEMRRGFLAPVHFSAKEYLLHQQSRLSERCGPFVDIVQAHFDIAFSCITNLTAASIVVPRLANMTSESEIETLVVQGSFGLQKYAHEFWAEHLRRYIASVCTSENQDIINALTAFCVVRKNNGAEEAGHSVTTFAAKDLTALINFPRLYTLVSQWLNFKADLEKQVGRFEDLRAQKEWELQKDETFLSLIDDNIRRATERLLNMDSSALPNHIQSTDYEAFCNRFNFSCRFIGCMHRSDSLRERDTHEATHLPSYVCQQCDFSGRGFRSPRELEKHTERYHMSPEDFEVPDTLYLGSNARGTLRRPLCWNEEGRKVLLKGFREIVVNLECAVASKSHDSQDQDVDMTTEKSNAIVETGQCLIDLDDIKMKINDGYYQTLAAFKDDIRIASNARGSKLLSGETQEIDHVLNQEIERIMTGFPSFSNLNSYTTRPTVGKNDADSVDDDADKTISAGITRLNLTGPCCRWSVTEEEQFPELLAVYKNDYTMIADFLKTKTADDVRKHYLQLMETGRVQRAEEANTDTIDSDRELDLDKRDSGVQDEPQESLMPEECPQDHSNSPSNGMSHGRQDMPLQPIAMANIFAVEDPHSYKVTHTLKHNAHTEHIGTAHKPKHYVRSRPQPVLCDYCEKKPDGYFDAKAVMNHMRRCHEETRLVWLCKDMSVNNDFWGNCASCNKNKKYDSKRKAATHLRTNHFPSDTAPATLTRWIEKKQEPNLKYQEPSATRKVWICKDIAPERLSFANCQFCATFQRYSSRYLAIGHLREVHFMPETATKILMAGVYVIEEARPAYVPLTNSVSKLTTDPNQLPSIRETIEGKEFENGSHLNRILRPSSESDRSSISPSATPYELANSHAHLSSPKAQEPNVRHESATSSSQIFLRDVSFDNILSTCPDISYQFPGFESTSTNPKVPPYLANQALIRSDHVQRLPHLNPGEKLYCQDHVDALYGTLAEATPGTSRYEHALDGLENLSRTLLKGVQDWRRR